MAKTKQVKQEEHFIDTNKKIPLATYKPLPKFGSGCNTC